MTDEYGENEFDPNVLPLAYLITIRTYGTRLPGGEQLTVRRHRKGQKESKLIEANVPLLEKMREEMTHAPVIFNVEQRQAVESAIKEVCKHRGYILDAVNVRTNHAHAVIGAKVSPERLADSLKAYSTRRLREEGLVSSDTKIWARGRSRKYLWKQRHVEAAIDYVLYGQGDLPFE